MGFLSGSITWERYWIGGDSPRQFGPEHLETLEQFAIGKVEIASPDQPTTGFLAGDHLLDLQFGFEKNVIGDALHFGVRIDSNQIPAAVRRAWLQMELAALSADNPSGRPNKAQRQEAKDAVEARCAEEAKSGRFRRMQQFPMLWDARHGLLYFGGSSAAASELATGLCERAFELELSRITSGKLASSHAAAAEQLSALDEVQPTAFGGDDAFAEIRWWNGESSNHDYLGNEFLLWLWWHFETRSDTVVLPDGSEVTGMFARTLALECPRGESGKETISAESPVHLPEAALAIRSGKLPRKAGLTLVRYGQQYDLALQAETFNVSGARIKADEDADGDDAREDRLESLRGFSETLDLLFNAFCQRRIGAAWEAELGQLRGWLKTEPRAARRPAA